MAKLLVTDELTGEVVDITSRGSFETVPLYDYAYLSSSTGSGIAVSSSCYLHSVIVANTGGSGNWLVLADMSDTDSACPGTDTSAEKIAQIYGGTRKVYVFDTLINYALCYRLSGEHADDATGIGNDGITITYKLAS